MPTPTGAPDWCADLNALDSPFELLAPEPPLETATSTPTRLAFLITDLDVGGAERALVELVTRLDRSRWEPAVYCLSSRGVLADELAEAGVPTVCFGAHGIRHLPGVVIWLSRQLRASQPALLQTYLFHANMVGRFAARLARVPNVVCGIRVAERRSRARLWIDRLTDSLVTRHVCVSDGVARFSAEKGRLPLEKLTVISNGVDAERFAQATAAHLSQFGIPAESRTILFVGRLDPQKGPFVLLAAVERLLATYHDVHVLLVGDGPLRQQIDEWVTGRQLGSRIHFAGRRDDVAELMRAAYCLVLPSLWEGLPNVVLEAMAAGLPVLATDVEGISDLIENHRTGLVVPCRSPQQLAGGLALLLAAPDQARALAQAAQEYVANNFTWDQVVRRYEALYGELLGGATQSPGSRNRPAGDLRDT